MANVLSATISGSILTIVYDEAMTALPPGGIFSSSGAPLDVMEGGFIGDGTNTWTLTLDATIDPGDYIIMTSDGTNAVGTYSGTYLGWGTSFVGGSGDTVIEPTDMDDGYQYQHPWAFYGNEGEDFIVVSPWNAFISLTEAIAASDTVSFDDQWVDRPLEDMDLIAGFDVTGTSTNDKLSLLSGMIEGNAVVDGADVGVIASHEIVDGIVTFKNAGGSVLAVGIDTEIEDAYKYLDINIATVGATVAFQGNGEIDGLIVFQKGATGINSFVAGLDGISGVTLSNTAGTNVVQIVDTTAPLVQQAAMTSTGIDLYFAETVTAIETTGINLYKNGVTDMGALTSTTNGATVNLASTSQTLLATDFVVIDAMATTSANTASDGVNTGVYVEPFKMALGGAGNNVINLSLLTDVAEAEGQGGADTITGSAGDDWISGGDGNDLLYGGDGDDEIDGDAGNDLLDGGIGNDEMEGGAGNDTYILRDAGDEYWENDSDIITGGNDTVETYLAVTNLNWNVENIRILNTGDADVFGNDQSNTVYAGVGNNVMQGGMGIDTLSYEAATAGVAVNLAVTTAQITGGSGTDTIAGFENLVGSNYADTLTGNDAWEGNTINGGLGNDIIDGGTGSMNNQTLIGGLGVDTLSYATATGGVKINLAVTWSQYNSATGSDTISGFENLTGSAYNDVLTGNAGANIINGGLGDDLLIGGLGVDTLSYATGASAGVKVNLALITAQATVGSGSDTISGFEKLTGSQYADTLTGNAGANTIDGGAGNDVVNGGAGNDILIGGLGVDILSYATGASAGVKVNLALTTVQATVGSGSDTISGFEKLTGSQYADTLTGNAGANTILGGAGNDVVNGGAGNDILNGGVSNDTLNGALGNDSLTGGTGADSFLFANALNASTNKDTITDFIAVDDTIKLENAIFTKLTTTGTLNSDFFSSTGVATDSNDYIIYNPTSGALFYDADGNAGGAAVQFALLGTTTHPTITNADFVVY